MDEYADVFQKMIEAVCRGVKWVDVTPEPEEFEDCAWPNEEYGG